MQPYIVYQEYPSSIPLVYKQCPDLLYTRSAQEAAPVYKKCPSSTSVAYKECPSSSSSVQGVPKLVHMLCTNWALDWAISKHFPSLGTLKCHSLDTACSHL